MDVSSFCFVLILRFFVLLVAPQNNRFITAYIITPLEFLQAD